MLLDKNFRPQLPSEFKAMMRNLDQNSDDIMGDAKAMADRAIGYPAKETCHIVINFLDELIAKNLDGQTLNDVWFSTPVEIPPIEIGYPDENTRILREFFTEMRRLLAKRLQELVTRS